MNTSKKKTIYLHIGRHKTGTSSIQNFIASYPESLSSQSLYYPETGRHGIAHHEIAAILSFKKTKNDTLKRAAIESNVISTLKAEIDSQPTDVLISSEGLQNSDPALVAEVFSEYQIKILVYIRNQIDYLASAYAQKVWATNYAESMETYYKDIFNPDYEFFLSRWENISQGGISIAKFTRENLYQSDIVADFFIRMLGIDDTELTKKILAREIIDSNPSLTSELLAYKCAYNSYNYDYGDAVVRQLRNALAELSRSKSSPPVRATKTLARNCMERCKESNQVISNKYFDGRELFNMERSTSQPIKLDYDLSFKISRELVSCNSNLEPVVNKFMKDAYPLGNVA